MLFRCTDSSLFTKHLSLTGDGLQNLLLLHQLLFEEITVHVSQLLYSAQSVEVLGDVDTTAIEVDTGDVGIFDQELQYTDNGFPMAEYRGGTEIVRTDIIILEEHTGKFILILPCIVHRTINGPPEPGERRTDCTF